MNSQAELAATLNAGIRLISPGGVIFNYYVLSSVLAITFGIGNFYLRLFSVANVSLSQNIAIFFVVSIFFSVLFLISNLRKIVGWAGFIKAISVKVCPLVCVSVYMGLFLSGAGYVFSLALYVLDFGQFGTLHAIPISGFILGMIGGLEAIVGLDRAPARSDNSK